jgi:uncharacterized membrane protein
MRKLLAAPLHPIFTHFTIALTASSLGFDVAGRLLGIASLSAAGWWTLAIAVPMTVGTLVSGITSRLRLPMEEGESRRWLRTHMALGPSFFGGLVVLAVWRAAIWRDGVQAPWSYLAAMLALLLVMTAQGYLGGELVYRFGAEVRGSYARLPSARREATPPPSTSRSPRHAGSADRA